MNQSIYVNVFIRKRQNIEVRTILSILDIFDAYVSNFFIKKTLISSYQSYVIKSGAGKGNRTFDLLITRQLLYRLSYSGSK